MPYSNWKRIDLHIHSDASRKTKHDDYEGTFSIDTLHQKLIENDVEIFSLTDHNLINLSAYKEYYEKYSDPSSPLLLVGVELDIDHDSKTYHSLLIFNYCTPTKAEAIHNQLEKHYAVLGHDIYERKITLDDIIRVFPNDDFFFIPHAGNTASIKDGYKGELEEAQKMLILLQSPLEKVDEKRRAIYNEGFDKIIYEAFRNKHDYAYIEFSDNHNVAKYPCKHKGHTGDHDFYYIKGSKNFETLRLAFIDPKSRIKSQAEYNTIVPNFNYLEQISIQDCAKIENKELCFSPHLNVIIGGRSSGKSLMLDIINRKIDTLTSHSNYDSMLADAHIKIKASLDATFKDSTHFDSSIIQINQGDIVNFFENSNLGDLAKKAGKNSEYDAAKIRLSEKKSALQKLVNDLLDTYQSAFEANVNQSVVLHQKTVDMLLSEEYVLKCDVSEIERSLYIVSDIDNTNEIISAINTNVTALKKQQLLKFSQSELEVIAAFEKLIADKLVELNAIIKYQGLTSTFLSEVNKCIIASNSELSKEGQEKAIAQESLIKLTDKVNSAFVELAKLNNAIKSINSISVSFKEQVSLDDDCSLCLEVHSDESIASQVIESIKSPGTFDLYVCLTKLLANQITVKNFASNTPDDFRKKVNTTLGSLYSKFDLPMDYLEYQDGTTSKNNSPGYNSEKYLQVILNNPNSRLVLIDQPEDNLGNQFISEKLVDIIRAHKFKKQFILVTHNPAIVVYGDAECIIMAENESNKITYSQIKLETENSQKSICSILDGGEYIFDKRAQKYNIPKLMHKENS
jgi:predicted ATPase